LAWVAAILVLIAALGYFIVKPLVERALMGAGAVIGVFALAAAEAAQVSFEMACDQVRQSPEAIALVGEPIVCAPIEETEWLDPQGRQTLEFKFGVKGPKGAGVAHAVVAPIASGFEIRSVELRGPAGDVVLLPLP
jgi:hypothetical protein